MGSGGIDLFRLVSRVLSFTPGIKYPLPRSDLVLCPEEESLTPAENRIRRQVAVPTEELRNCGLRGSQSVCLTRLNQFAAGQVADWCNGTISAICSSRWLARLPSASGNSRDDSGDLRVILWGPYRVSPSSCVQVYIRTSSPQGFRQFFPFFFYLYLSVGMSIQCLGAVQDRLNL
jgi:hypothetical protein